MTRTGTPPIAGGGRIRRAMDLRPGCGMIVDVVFIIPGLGPSLLPERLVEADVHSDALRAQFADDVLGLANARLSSHG